ncbi:MAG: DbpA RNA binding domain-containing protein, partial [Chthoniobacterales bacterium]
APAGPSADPCKPVAKRAPVAADDSSSANEPPRKAKPGKAWLRVGLSRDAVKNPRDIVDLLVEAAGLPSREVGFIALGNDSSYAEVPVEFCQGLSPSGNVLQGSRGDVTIWPVPTAAKKKRR